ncbi:terminase large subunit [Dyadobacter sp. CY323]|uniref:terminase large subunit n=1 Tax=Dyadobacter sp. CY323 TaxID=2907302 RepID=UPI001F189C3C|nr:terminase TerL endonuclease subunit [Dyadobacter sp. CY323]MCE6992091.1 terminase large subunit [Dyadobacter sp. CY323]
MKVNKIETAYQYADDIRSGKIPACKYVRLAVEKYHDQQARSEELGIIWDEKAAQRVLSFIELLCFTAGSEAGKPFKLEGWQSFLVANLFGWKKYDSTDNQFYRVYRECYCEIPKKNGKTELGAAIAIYMLVADKEDGAQVYTAAYTRDQARLCFNAAQRMVKKSPFVKKRVRSLTNNMSVPESFSTMSAISHDAGNSEGKNTHCAIYDEFHVHLTDDLKMSLESGMASRKQPILFTPTTAGSNKQAPCYKFRQTCINILEGRSNISDTFALIFTIDEDDDWNEEATWWKANPNLGVSKQLEYLRNKYKKAKENGREEVDFKTKQLNLWVDAAITWLKEKYWDACSDPLDDIPLDAVCYGGVDLGETSDFTAYSKYFPDYNYVTTRYYVPEETAEYAARFGIDYKQWANDGFMVLTPGKTTDHEWLKQDIYEDASKYDMRFISMDPWHAAMLKLQLEEELGTTYAAIRREDGSLDFDYHSKVQTYKQAAANMSPPTKQFEEIVMNGTLRHDGNPISAWMLKNVALHKDAIGNIRPDKAKSRDKIDGIVAKIIAIGTCAKWHSGTDNYTSGEFTGII